jgi:LPXTG-motif cell wall-anchored protein
MGNVVITDYKFPPSCMAGTGFDWYAAIYIKKVAVWPFFGFRYVDGPSSYIAVTKPVGYPPPPYLSVINKNGTAYFDLSGGTGYVNGDTSIKVGDGNILFPIEGTYTLEIYAGENNVITDGPYRVTIQATPAAYGRFRLDYYFPNKAVVNTKVDAGAYITAIATESQGGINPTAGLMYVDGPSPSINFEGAGLGKGETMFYTYFRYHKWGQGYGTDAGWTIFPMAGTHRLAALAGYYDVAKLAVTWTDRADVTVEVVEAPLPPPPQPKVSAAPILVAVGLCGLVIGGLVYFSKRRKKL